MHTITYFLLWIPYKYYYSEFSIKCQYYQYFIGTGDDDKSSWINRVNSVV